MIHPRPLARSSDPATSHEAAAEVTRSGERDRQLTVVLDAVRQFPGLTSCELAARGVGLDRYQFARRLPELEGDGLVRKGPVRACTVSGRNAVTWEASDSESGGRDMRRSKCKSCGAEIIWAKTPKGKAIPVDAEPTEAGNICLLDISGKVEAHFPARGTVAVGTKLYASHFASCPDAKQHRQGQLSDSTTRFVEGLSRGSSRHHEQQSAKDSPGSTEGPPDTPRGFLFDVSGDASRL